MTAVEDRMDCKSLLDMATPSLYRKNLFRILGLPVSASAADVRRQQKRLEMERKLGVTSSGATNGILTLVPPPASEETRAAMDRLADPEARLLDEVFWFWPLKPGAAQDPALTALAAGHAKDAATLWAAESQKGPRSHVALHNLAVLEHLTALDYEARLSASGLDEKKKTRLGDLWAKALGRWLQILNNEAFWEDVRLRVRDMDDARLTTGFVRRVRATLPAALLSINASLARDAAERQDLLTARHHVQSIRDSRFAVDACDAVLRDSVAPLRQRIKAALEHAKRSWEVSPQMGNRCVRELYAHSVPLLAIVDIMLPTEHASRVAMHDMLADAMLEGQIAFVRKTQDWDEGIKLLQLAEGVAAGATFKGRLPEQIAVLRKNAEDGNDWCSPGYWEMPADVVTTLEDARQRMESGDLDGAIRALLTMNAHTGLPAQRRCAACALSIKSVQICNQAQSAFQPETEAIRTILNRLRDLDERSIGLVLSNPPSPNMARFRGVPPCLCCASSSYSSWTTFKFKDIPLFMCEDCSARHNAELDRQRATLRAQIALSVQYLAIAQEIDPDDRGIQRNMATIRGIAREVGSPVRSTRDLKKQLGIVVEQPSFWTRLMEIFK
jgi:hypothetical protein